MASETQCSVYLLMATSTPVDTQEHATPLILKLANLLWTYGNGGEGNTTYAGFNRSLRRHYPTFIQNIAGGVIYIATNEHTIPNPLYKGSTYRAINATDGKEIWQLSGYPSEWSTPGSVNGHTADGFLTCMNGLDNNIYSIGRGPSKLTVSAPDLSAASGQAVVIQRNSNRYLCRNKTKPASSRLPQRSPSRS